MKKKALAIITCDRPDFLKKCVASIPENIDVIIINDGDPVSSSFPIIQTNRIGVGAAKNKALSYFYNKGIDHIFVMEEDILIKDPDVFDAYIKAAEKNNIKHLNFGLSSRKNPLLKTENGLNLYKNPYAGFSYFHRSVIDEVGLFDERFYNSLEHIDYTLRITLKELHTPLPYYADIEHNHLYLSNIVAFLNISSN